MVQLRYPRVDIVDVRQGTPDTPQRVTQPCVGCRHWHGWCRHYEACWNMTDTDVAAMKARTPEQPWTRERAVDAVHAWVTRTGRPPAADDWARRDDTHPSYQQVKRLFGNWTSMIVEAGYKTRSR